MSKYRINGLDMEIYSGSVSTRCKYCKQGFGIRSRFHTEQDLIDKLTNAMLDHYKTECYNYETEFREERLKYLLDKDNDSNSKS